LETGEDLVSWRDPVTGEAYANGVTQYVQSCVDPLGRELVCPSYPPPDVEFELEGRWELVMPEPIAVLDSDMTPAELDLQRQHVVDSILGLGTTGSPEEQPLCTLSRYLKQSDAVLPERVLFLVISDEDDTASVNDCLDDYTYRRRVSSGEGLYSGCTSDCDSYYYNVRRPTNGQELSFDCAPVDDFGNVGSEDTWTPMTLPLGTTVESCEDDPSAPCTQDEQRRADDACEAGFTALSCTKDCDEGGGISYCGFSTTEDVDLCVSSFEAQGATYDDLVDYCEQERGQLGWDDCEKTGFSSAEGTRWTESGYTSPLIAAHSLGDLIHLFHADAGRIFGEDNYFVESIVFEPDSECILKTGQSYATELVTIASSAEHVFPICESYAPALQRVDDFAQTLLQTEYDLELGEGESIESVEVHSRDGTTRTLVPQAYTHDPAEGVLHIDRAVLSSVDMSLSVQIVDPCVPRIR